MLVLSSPVPLRFFLILQPTVATGNVAQLAIDLLIYNLPPSTSPVRVARLEHPFVEPALASAPLGTPSLESEIALFKVTLSGPPLYILQQRSSTVRGHLVHFSRDLAAWVAGQGFGKVIVLSSLDSKTRADRSLDDMRPRLIPVEGSQLDVSALSAATSLPVYEEAPEAGGRPVAERRTQPWALVNGLKGQDAVSLAGYATEGDNERDAELLASGLVAVLVALGVVGEAKEMVRGGAQAAQEGALSCRWMMLESWSQSLYAMGADGDEYDFI